MQLTCNYVVLVQTVAVAVGSMPLTAGLVGVIPALEKLLKPEEGGPLALTTGQLVVWSLGVALFGVFFAVPCKLARLQAARARGSIAERLVRSTEAVHHQGEIEVP